MFVCNDYALWMDVHIKEEYGMCDEFILTAVYFRMDVGRDA